MGLNLVPAKAQDKEKHTPLGKQMEAVSDAFKAFRKETDPKKGAALARDAEQATLKATLEIPELVKDMPGGPEKVKAALEYRKEMGKLFLSLCDVEDAFNRGKLDEVAKIVTTLKDMKKEGHKKFQKDDQ
jgi:soluble cytochrome b562